MGSINSGLIFTYNCLLEKALILQAPDGCHASGRNAKGYV